MEGVVNDNFFTMLKGEPGTFKSTQALTYPLPQYWLSYDQKMNSLILPMKHFGISPKDINYDNFSTWNEGRKKLEEFRVNFPYKTLIIDSITSTADNMLRQTLTMKQGLTRNSGGNAGKQIAGISVNELEDFNAEAAGLTELIALTKDIHNYHKCNVILIAHVIRVEEKSLNKEVTITRSIVTAGKKPAAKIPAYCDEVYHFNIGGSMVVGGEGKLEVYTTNTSDDFARTSLPMKAKIELGREGNLYRDHIKPAIEKLKLMPTTTVI